MRDPEVIERDIHRIGSELDNVAMRLGQRIQRLQRTAHPARRPFVWGTWLSIAAGMTVALIVGLKLLRR